MAIERANQYKGKATCSVVFASCIAALFGWLVGYSGILGQVTGEDAFYDLFLTDISGQNPRDYDYCKYGHRYSFPLMGGPVYLAAALASILSYPIAVKYGRRMSIIIAGVVSLIGAAIGVYPMFGLLIASQIILGFGIGLGVQVSLMYLSETAPSSCRGAMNTRFQLWIAIGMLGGNMIRRDLDQETSDQVWKFYLSFALPVVPTLLIVIGGAKYFVESPNSLVERGSTEKGREVLASIRGTHEVDVEFQDIVEASELANATRQNHFLAAKNIFRRRNRPQLVMVTLLPLFSGLTGAVFVLFYAPLLFWSSGSRYKSATYSTAINGSILILSALVSMYTVDKIGRKVLLISGGVFMFLSQVVIAILLGSDFSSEQLTTDRLSIIVTILIGVFVAAYGWSWGPLGWIIPSETLSLETRSVGTSIAVSINFVIAFLVLQFFVPLLCAFKYGLFLFFAGWIVVMTIFVCLFLPETKGVPIEETNFLWSKHWFWKKFVAQDLEVLHVTQNSSPPKQV